MFSYNPPDSFLEANALTVLFLVPFVLATAGSLVVL